MKWYVLYAPLPTPIHENDPRPRATLIPLCTIPSSIICLSSPESVERSANGMQAVKKQDDEGFYPARRKRCNSGAKANDQGQDMKRLIEGRAWSGLI